MTPLDIPPDYHRIRIVQSFDELISTPFGDGVNALCWQRTLDGDYSAVVEQLGGDEEITTLDEERLRALSVSAAGTVAIDCMLEDLRRLTDHGLSPVLDCIQHYPRDEATAGVPTDVYSFHADSAPVAADTYLCTYHGATSEGLRNDEAQRRVDVPVTRAELLKLYSGDDDEGFRIFLNEHCYDLHYAPLPHAQPFAFGVGNLWRIAVEWPGSPVPPCIHRAPENLPGQPARLLLIS